MRPASRIKIKEEFRPYEISGPHTLKVQVQRFSVELIQNWYGADDTDDLLG